MDHFSKTTFGFLCIFYQSLPNFNRNCIVLANREIYPCLATIFCVHCTLCSCRWTHLVFQRRSPSWFIEWIIELVISVVLTIIFVNELWEPFIASSIKWCVVLGAQLERWNHCIKSPALSALAEWFRIRSPDVIPYFGSVWMLYAMLRLTGQWRYCKKCVGTLGKICSKTANNLLYLVWPSENIANSNVGCPCDIEIGKAIKTISSSVASNGSSKRTQLRFSPRRC